MLTRLLEPEEYLCILYTELIDWDAVQRIVNILHPLNAMTMEMQQSSANTETILYVVTYLQELVQEENSLNGAISHVLEKHVSNNSVINGLVHKEGRFLNFVRTNLVAAETTEQKTQGSRQYFNYMCHDYSRSP